MLCDMLDSAAACNEFFVRNPINDKAIINVAQFDSPNKTAHIIAHFGKVINPHKLKNTVNEQAVINVLGLFFFANIGNKSKPGNIVENCNKP